MSGDEVWQDRKVDIDLPTNMFELRVGEMVAAKFSPVEDSKENQRIKGVLRVTNLRVLWNAAEAPRVNLSIGMDCIINFSNKHIKSKLEGVVETVKVLTQCEDDRKEFAFKCALEASRSISCSLRAVHSSYQSSRLYRSLSLRNPLQRGFSVLPRELLCRRVPGVCNLSDDQGYIGEMIVTNIRVLWSAFNNHLHNVSLPYMQVKSLFLHNSKFGPALTFETTQVSMGYRFGFRMDPAERMSETYREIKKLIQAYRHKPDFGVDLAIKQADNQADNQEEAGQWREDNCEIDSRFDRRDVYSVLKSAGSEGGRKPDVVYNDQLGLMLEALPCGLQLEALCRVLG